MGCEITILQYQKFGDHHLGCIKPVLNSGIKITKLNWLARSLFLISNSPWRGFQLNVHVSEYKAIYNRISYIMHIMYIHNYMYNIFVCIYAYSRHFVFFELSWIIVSWVPLLKMVSSEIVLFLLRGRFYCKLRQSSKPWLLVLDHFFLIDPFLVSFHLQDQSLVRHGQSFTLLGILMNCIICEL